MEMERAVLVGVLGGRSHEQFDADMHELSLLTQEAGAEPQAELTWQRSDIDRTSYIGRGKLEELKELVAATEANVVVALDELTPGRVRHMESGCGVRVIDRTEVILAIFARRATSKEGKLQVELAQLNYMLPRLSGGGTAMSRLGGGIGTRGPGETKLEVDRRHIRERVASLRRRLREVGRRRDVTRAARKSAPLVALVGYTNAGKSTLLRRLSGDDTIVGEDRLFATLDAVVRRVELPSQREVFCADTVGFVTHLPHTLVAAFRATLQEVARADLIVHVVDGASDRAPEQIQAVRDVLNEIEAHNTPELLVFNKVDLKPSLAPMTGGVCVSARTGQGIEQLRLSIDANLPRTIVEETFFVPYEHYAVVAWLHDHGEVQEQIEGPSGLEITARLESHLVPSVRARLP